MRTSPAALVIGEALIDIVERPDTLGDTAVAVEHVGGSPANVAMGLARLGHETQLATHLGADDRGARVRDYLEAEGVHFSAGSWGAARTSTARAVIDSRGSAHYDFDIDWQFQPPDTTTPPTLVHTGSIALFLEPGGTAVAEYLLQLPRSVIVTLDPNIRAPLMPDRPAALTRFERAAARANLVKMSDEDALWLYPDLSVEAAARHVMELGHDPGHGPRITVATLGAAGAFALTPKHSIKLPAAPANVVDTISAGDSFMAALASSLLQHGVTAAADAIDAVLERATRAAAIAVSAAGAHPPRAAELDSACVSEERDASAILEG